MATLLKIVRWLLAKAAMAAGIVVLGLTAYGLWLFLRDNVDFDLRGNELVRAMTGERAHVQAALQDVQQRLDATAAAMAAERERIRQIESVMAQLKGLASTWDRVIGNPEQQESNLAQLKRLREMRAAAEVALTRRQQESMRTTWEKDGLEIALGRLDTKMKAVEAQQSRIAHYLKDAWDRSKVWIITALALYFFGPSAGKLLLYFGFAPLVMRGRPVRLTADLVVMPEITESRVSLDLPMPPGEQLWIKERFLQTSDEGFVRRTRFLLDWSIPFTCLASGLVELIEMRNPARAVTRHVTLSNEANPHVELTTVTLPAGSALVLRPSFLIGVLAGSGERLTIRRRWQLWRWQAWVTMQFRFFEFSGPCRLVLAGNRGVRAERLADAASARRANQDATIGFTPDLDYLSVRAETFWGYYRGMNPLFDDLFAGRGLFLCQQISSEGEAGRARKFWAGVWGGVLKAFGL